MSAHLGKIALLVVMSQAFRLLGRTASPRWAGLALGLPCSTAVALVGGGAERGVDYAVAMSGASLIGLAGAVALPVAYSRVVLLGGRWPWAILAGVASYLGVAFAAGRLLPGDARGGEALALLAVAGAATLASKFRLDDDSGRLASRPMSPASKGFLRTCVPIACLAAALGLGDLFGPSVAGLMSTFPGVTLSVLCLTHLESGPSSALRMARALPAGNLGMVAFLATFRFGGPALGLAWGTTLAYAAALATLAVVVGFDGLKVGARRFSRQVRAWLAKLEPPRRSPAPTWPRGVRRFSPLIERLAA